MKLFWEYIILQHLIKGKQRGTFTTINRLFLTISGESTQAADEDAYLVDKEVLLRPRKQI